MAARKNNTAVTLTVAGSKIDWTMDQKVRDQYRAGDGDRFTLGMLYKESNEEQRELLTSFFGAGRVRRGLKVLAKTLEGKEVTDTLKMSENLRTVKVAKEEPKKASKKVTAKSKAA